MRKIRNFIVAVFQVFAEARRMEAEHYIEKYKKEYGQSF